MYHHSLYKILGVSCNLPCYLTLFDVHVAVAILMCCLSHPSIHSRLSFNNTDISVAPLVNTVNYDLSVSSLLYKWT